MRPLRLLFAPELGRSLAGPLADAARLARLLRTAFPAPPPGPRPRLRDLPRSRRFRLGAVLAPLGLLALAPLVAGAQSFEADLFAAEDAPTRDLLAFLGDLAQGGDSALRDMLLIWNGGLLVLSGALLLWHTVSGTVDTARQGRWGFGGWEILRIVLAVALMAPIPNQGLSGAQHAVLALARLGGDFAQAVWKPFSATVLASGGPSAPAPKASAWRTSIARSLISETCMRAANLEAARAGDPAYVRIRDGSDGDALVRRYAAARSGLPADPCGRLVWPAVPDGDAQRRIRTAHINGYRAALARLAPLADRLAGHFVPSEPDYGRPLPDIAAALDASGAAAAYLDPVRAAVESAGGEDREALRARIAARAENSSWVTAATFFNELASQTGSFQRSARAAPSAQLPPAALAGQVPVAWAAVAGVAQALEASPDWRPRFAAGTAAPAEQAGLSLFGLFEIEVAPPSDTGNPIADFASMGHDLITTAVAGISGLSAAAAGSGLMRSIPFVGKGLDVFRSAWQVADSFVSTVLGVLLIAGIVLAYLLPAIPFVRFLFATLGWLVNVTVAVVAITVFAAAHVTRSGEGDRLAVPATRQGWMLLPAIVLRPTLMVFGLILGHALLTAAHGLLHDAWAPFLTDATGGSLGLLGYTAMLVLFVMMGYALVNACFKLIDILPQGVQDLIGSRVLPDGGGADAMLGTAAASAGRAGALAGIRVPGRPAPATPSPAPSAPTGAAP